MRAALAVCERFQHESSSPCYRSSGGWVECSPKAFGIRSFLRSNLERSTQRRVVRDLDTEPEKRGDRVQDSAFGLSVGELVHHPDNQARFRSPCLNRPVDRQAYQGLVAPSSSRLPPRQTRAVKSPRRRSPSLYSAQLRTWYFFCFACLYWQRLGYFMLEHTSATTIGGFRSQPERCNNAQRTAHPDGIRIRPRCRIQAALGNVQTADPALCQNSAFFEIAHKSAA